MKEDIVLRGIGKADNDLKAVKYFEKLDRDKISHLTLYAVEIRYPEEHIETDLEEVKEFYKLAKEVRELVIRRLNETGLKISK
jgi:hypothetical protein